MAWGVGVPDKALGNINIEWIDIGKEDDGDEGGVALASEAPVGEIIIADDGVDVGVTRVSKAHIGESVHEEAGVVVGAAEASEAHIGDGQPENVSPTRRHRVICL